MANYISHTAWNKGLTKETDSRLAKTALLQSKIKKGKPNHPQTAETRAKISAARKKYIAEHPDQVPFKMHHSSEESYPERYFRLWLKKEKLLEVQELQIDRYTLDFAWPDKKIYLEIDGNQHKLDWMQEHDKIRTEYLNNLGWICIGRVDWSWYQALCTKEKHKYLQNIKIAIEQAKFIEKFISKKDLVLQKRQELINAGFVMKDGRTAPWMLTNDEWQRRLDLILNSNIDLTKYGWKEKVIKTTGLSLRQVDNVIKHFPERFTNIYIRGK